MEKLYVVANTNAVIFPDVTGSVLVDETFYRLLKKYRDEDNGRLINVMAEKHANGVTSIDDIHQFGTLVEILTLRKTDRGYLVTFDAISRVRIESLVKDEKGLIAEYEEVSLNDDLKNNEKTDMLKYAKEIIKDIGDSFPRAKPLIDIHMQSQSIEELIGHVLPVLNISAEEKQNLLEELSLRSVSIKFIDYLLVQKEDLSFQIELNKKSTDEYNEQYRKMMIRNQIKSLQSELNEGEDSDDENSYEDQLKSSKMPDYVKKVVKKELKKLASTGETGSEANVIRTYLDTLFAVPWRSKKKKVDIHKARKVLDENHYGMEDVKERVLQHLAVMQMKKNKQGSILLLVGPPGTGKTSLAKSVASALGRKYVRASLGGVRDEAEIRGHRRTYVGALPGRIIAGMKKAGTRNPVFVLDEIDKLTSSYSGDPASALLEVLDPEQNNTFSDHYLEVPYDLSDVFFVATANDISRIPAPLLDRMEVIQISSYTTLEKYHILKDYLLPEVIENHGLTEEMVKLTDDAIYAVIEKYTREAGVRGLKKQLAKIMRVLTEKIVSGKEEAPFLIKEEMLLDILGNKTVIHDKALDVEIPGIVTGLAYTTVGGDILFIESTYMKGHGRLTLTGKLGDVMKESATIALSLVRSRLGNELSDVDFSKIDLHIHVPNGAVPKDGPSAGVTLFTTIASLLIGVPIDNKLAMTGEITLSGRVLPIGGLKEKVLAAYRAGITRVIIPINNVKDLSDIDNEIKQVIEFIPVSNVDELLEITIGKENLNTKIIFDLTQMPFKLAPESVR